MNASHRSSPSRSPALWGAATRTARRTAPLFFRSSFLKGRRRSAPRFFGERFGCSERPGAVFSRRSTARRIATRSRRPLRSDRVALRHTSGMLPLLSNWFSGCRGGCGGGIFQPRSVRPGCRVIRTGSPWGRTGGLVERLCEVGNR